MSSVFRVLVVYAWGFLTPVMLGLTSQVVSLMLGWRLYGVTGSSAEYAEGGHLEQITVTAYDAQKQGHSVILDASNAPAVDTVALLRVNGSEGDFLPHGVFLQPALYDPTAFYVSCALFGVLVLAVWAMRQVPSR